MTIEEFRMLELEDGYGPFILHLKGEDEPIRSVWLKDPLPTPARPVLLFTIRRPQVRTFRFFFRFPYRTGRLEEIGGQVLLDRIESLRAMPRLYRKRPAGASSE
ncbi:hypothetical protein [Larkinella soli]|uniref:hypothetical protein n=1 Tax=Larkinella soli TaxID=1770527 RepID=UPI000FFB44AD|nr:hypothetical protein [Larkinella soli]